MATETRKSKNFEAEVTQILDLVINSLYSNKDIFLRELISNSSDALDKLRFQALTNNDLLGDEELEIKVWQDSENKKLFIQDNGIGLSEEDLVENLGTIAKSGTKEFIKNMKDQKDSFDSSLIGQFGVGFYSAFIVADKVQEISRKAVTDKYHMWESEAKSNYEIYVLDEKDLETYSVDKFNQGTTIILSLKEDDDSQSFLEEFKVRQVVKRYSDFIEYPIKLKVSNMEFGKEDSETKDQEFLWENLNSQKALWTRPKNEIKEEEYNEFYSHVSHDYSKPFDYLHYKAEGTNEFTALLYLPQKAPFDLFVPESQKGLQLYINKVFITSDLDLLLPKYLRFIKGVVDATDLPLNVSREILQQNPRVEAIKKNVSKKLFSKFADLLKKDREAYTNFHKQFGAVIKEGVHVDHANREKIFDVLLFETTKTKPGEFITLQEYLDRAPINKDNEKEFIYLTGESRAEIENSPYLEGLKEKDVEVLLLTDPIDEWVVMPGNEYKNTKFKSAAKGELESDEKQKEETEKQQKEFGDLVSTLKGHLDEKVSEIRFSNRLVNTLCCLVVDETGMSAHMERIFEQAKQELPKSKRILELNPKHEVVKKLNDIFNENKEDERIKDYADLIHGQAMLLEGSKIEDLPRFTQLVTKLMAN